MKRFYILLTAILTFANVATIVAQTGPAGVGNADGSNGQPENIFWLDAGDLGLNNNDLVTSWLDKSGNGNDLSQTGVARPTFKDASDPNYSINAVSFDGTDDFLPFDGNLLVGTDYTILLVGTRKSNGREVIMGGSVGGGNQNLHPYFNTNNLHSHQWGNDHNAGYTGGDGSSANAVTPDFGIFGFRLNSSLGADQRALYQNGEIIGTRNNNAQLSAFVGAALGRFEAVGEFSDIEIAELIIYADALNEAQQVIIQNYLSSKYNITLDANEFYAGDTPANGDFDLNVTGVGQQNSSVVQTATLEGFSVNANTSLDANGEFILFGEDNTVNAVTAANVGAGVAERWEKTWYLDKTGTLGASLSFDIQEGIAGGLFPAGDVDNYVLLRYNGTTYDEVPLAAIAKTVTGSAVQFDVTNAELISGEYTLGTANATDSPLLGEPNQTWYSFESIAGSEEWNDPLTWTLDGAANPAYVNPGSELPDPTDNVVIRNGTTVTLTDNNRLVSSLEVIGTLDVAATSGHNFNEISGIGTIRLSGAAGIGNFPAGDVSDFADNFIGGTVEYYGAGLTVTENRTFNNVIVNLSSSANDLILMSDVVLNGDLTITRGDFQINDNSSTTVKSIVVNGDVLVDANGAMSVGTGNTIGTFSINPNNMPASGNYHDIFHQVVFRGDFINQGNVRFTNQTNPVYNEFTTSGAATVRFEGASNNSASLFGTTDFYNIVVDKGVDETFEIEINSNNTSNFSLYGPNTVGRNAGGGFTAANPEVRKALWIYRGTLHLTGSLSIPTLSEGNQNGGNGDYAIGATAGLWIDGPNVEVYSTADNVGQVPAGSVGVNGGGSNQALSLYGKFRITDGVFGTRGSAGFIFWNADAGEVLIEGGEVNVSQFRSAGGGSGIYSYTQSGGEVLVRANEGQPGERSGTYSLFSLDTEDAVFNMSGGKLTVYGNDGESIFINSAPGNFSVTGGTVRVENRDGTNAIISSRVPFWNLEVARDQGGDAGEIDLITSTSGGNTITNPDLVVLNDFIIETGINFDHNGNDVTVGSDFTVSLGASYEFAESKPNTLTLNGTDNSKMALLNIDGGGSSGDVQRFYNLTINKPHGTEVTLESSKSGGEFNSFQNNLFRVDGEAFKLLSGTLNQGRHSLLVNSDTLVNYDVLTVYNEALGTSGVNDDDQNANGNNDQIKLAANQGTPTDIVLITADTAVIGNLKFFMEGFVVDLNSDLTIQYLEHNNGRFNIQDNKLKVTFYNENVPGGGGSLAARGLTNMIVTDGNSSDGGLSLGVRANQTYTFPIGIGLTGSAPSSKYTPATVDVSNFSDDGFITIRPVDRVLATTDGTGGDILSYHWRVDYEDFTVEPTVEYQFTYYDDDLDGSVNESLFAAGKVLEIDPFTRSFEDDPAVEGVDDINNIITFNGPSDTGFTLEEASYTAGESGRFVGSPQVYYTRKWNNNSNTVNRWSSNNSWSLVETGGPIAGSIPGSGDIVIFGAHGPDHGFSELNVRLAVDVSTTGIAAAIFEEAEAGEARARVFLERNTTHDWATVRGNGEIQLFFNAEVEVPTFNTDNDLGDFLKNPNSLWNLKYEGNGGATRGLANAVTLPSFPSTFPNLRIAADGNSNPGGADGWGNQHILTFPDDIVVNGTLQIQNRGALWVQSNIDIADNLEIGEAFQNGRLRFDNGDIPYTVTIGGDVIVGDDNENDDDDSFLDIQSEGTGSANHLLRVGGDIRLLSNSDNGILDLNNASADDSNVILEFIGNGVNSFTNQHTVVPGLYRIIMNKGNSRTNSFSFDNDFNLSGTSNTSDKAVVLQNGTLRLNDNAIDIDLTSGGDSFVIPATASLQITQGLANVSGDDSGIILDGSIILDGGTLDMTGAGNGNNFIEYSASGNALLEISDGSLLVGSQIRPNPTTPSGVLNYNQTGGTVEVGVNAAPVADRGVFEIINTGSSFTYTGGTLSIRRQNTASPVVSAIRILPTSSNITQPIIVDAAVGMQSNLGINSNVPLAGLQILGTNSPTVVTEVNNLQLTGDLDIQAGASFNANSIDLILEADLINNGTFTASSNETLFISETNQEIRGANSVSFFDFSKTGSGILDLNGNPILVNGLFSHETGVINDNGNTIELKGNAVIEGEISSLVGGELLFSGSVQQQLTRLTAGVTTLGILTIANPVGVVIPEGNGYDFNISDGLAMNGGVFNIGSSALVVGQNAEITTDDTFSVTNMIKTNSSFADKGLTKVFPSGYTSTFVFPIGEIFYTPVTVDFSIAGGTSGTSVGSISAKPANERHPTVTNVSGGYANEINNVLQYYWTLRSSDIDGLVADIRFNYDQSDVLTEDGAVTESTYIAARILAFDNSTEAINKFTTSTTSIVNPTTNTITFSNDDVFNGVGSNSISGDYFAGAEPAIPNNVATYTTDGIGGLVNDTDSYLETLPTDGVAPSGAVLIVSSGTELTFNVQNVQLYKTVIEAGGTLNIDNTDGHRLGIVEGTGNLKITSNTSSASIPPGDYGTFFSCSGGGLEYAGTGSYSVLGSISTLRNLTMSGSGDRDFPSNDVTICEDFAIDGPIVSVPTNRRITIEGNLIQNSGVFNAPSGSDARINVRLGNFELNGGTYNGGSSGRTNVVENVIINGGDLNLGTASYIFSIGGDLTFNSGTFNAGTAELNFRNYGPFAGSIRGTIIAGDLTGINSLSNVSVQKNEGDVQVVLNSNIEITGELELIDGLIVANGNDVILSSSASVSPARGRSNSYITGKVTKPLSAGQNFTFPIGSANLWRPATVNNVSAGGLTWEAQFFDGNVVTNTIASNLNPSDANVERLQGGEYWVISDGDTAPSGVTAEVGLSWGTETDVSADPAEREQLRVMVWNDGNQNWDNLGRESGSVSGTQAEGSLLADLSVGFSENIFVMGSTDSNNPLPVELTFFTAENKTSKVELKWQTASEKNNDFFEVQRSFDGKQFEVLGIVEGNGDSQSTIDYEFRDYSPLAGDSYYRLRQVDYDGAFEFSEVVKINRREASDLVAIPNPTQAQNIRLRLSGFHGEQKVQVTVFDLQGKRHYQAIHNPSDFNQALPIDKDLNSGIYIIDVQQGNIRKKVRLMVR